MWLVLKYIAITVLATFAGSITGMGGGVIIKPVLDSFGDFDLQTIGVLSSVTVFAMSLVSVLRQTKNKTQIHITAKIAICLAIFSILGGYAGQIFFAYLSKRLDAQTIKIMQNAILLTLLVFTLIFMTIKHKVAGFRLKNLFAYMMCGGVLGMLSSFLGIGGGPINVSLLILLFSLNTKTAVVYSLLIILFSQASKLLTITFTTGFAKYDLSLLPYMIVAGIVGAWFGSIVSKRLQNRQVDIFFNVIVAVILCISAFNIVI